jgi:hypothetical protein
MNVQLAEDFPRDVWVDVETGEWGLVSNLRLIQQTEIATTTFFRSRAERRRIGNEHGMPVKTIKQYDVLVAALRGIVHGLYEHPYRPVTQYKLAQRLDKLWEGC